MRFYIPGFCMALAAFIEGSPSKSGAFWICSVTYVLTGMIFDRIKENEND